MMNCVVDQTELSLARAPNKVDVPIEFIRAKKTAGAAITFACDVCGLDDKEIFMELGIDKGYFSNIKSGKATLQADLISAFCNIVGNHIYPEWLAYQVGCTLVQIESEIQRKLREVTEELNQERAERLVIEETMRRIITGKSS